MRRIPSLVALFVILASCGSSDVDFSAIPELLAATPESIVVLLSESDRPVVVTVWASWCIPCRSEAPLLERAADQLGERVQFIGLNVQDSQNRARAFIAEFFPVARISHFIDETDSIPIVLGGTFGVPQTFFFAPGGELVTLHVGVIDERTLALQLDEILARAP